MNKQTSDFQAVSSATVQSPIVPTQNILGVEVADLTLDEALKFTHGRLALELFTPITFLNAHNGNIAQREIHFADVLDDFTVFSDGIGVDIASKILYGEKFKANLNGTDFIPALLRTSPRRLKVALYGARPGIAKKAADAFAEMDDRHVYRSVGHGFSGAKKINYAAWLNWTRVMPHTWGSPIRIAATMHWAACIPQHSDRYLNPPPVLFELHLPHESPAWELTEKRIEVDKSDGMIEVPT